MTPQETDLVNALFDRLAKLEGAPRDAAAERLIADGLQRAPHAVYALVQAALVQDEALKRANARIEELQAQGDGAQTAEQQPPSFLESVREAFGGHPPARGSVPSVRPPPPGSQPQNRQAPGVQPEPGYPPPPPAGYPGGAPFGPGGGSFGGSSGGSFGGSFLGNAASAAAGVIGGALLLDGIRSMFGHHLGGYGLSSFGGFADDRSLPWSNASDPGAANSDLAHDLGADQIGSRDVGNDQPGDADSLADTDDMYNADDSDDSDDGDFGGDDSGGDSYDV